MKTLAAACANRKLSMEELVSLAAISAVSTCNSPEDLTRKLDRAFGEQKNDAMFKNAAVNYIVNVVLGGFPIEKDPVLCRCVNKDAINSFKNSVKKAFHKIANIDPKEILFHEQFQNTLKKLAGVKSDNDLSVTAQMVLKSAPELNRVIPKMLNSVNALGATGRVLFYLGVPTSLEQPHLMRKDGSFISGLIMLMSGNVKEAKLYCTRTKTYAELSPLYELVLDKVRKIAMNELENKNAAKTSDRSTRKPVAKSS